MNNIDVIKYLSNKKLQKNIEGIIGPEWFSLKKVVWGAGVSGKSFVDMYDNIDFEYIVDSRASLQNNTFNGLFIHPPEKLFKENPSKTIVFLPTVIHQKISVQLKNKGFDYIVVPNQFNTSGVSIAISKLDLGSFFDWLKKNEVKYVMLRWDTEDFSKLEDIDLLVAVDSVPKLLECEFLTKSIKGEAVSIDLKWSRPIGINTELPYFSSKLADYILNNVIWKNSISTVAEEAAIYSYIFHVLFHKAERSGLPALVASVDCENKYVKILKHLQETLDIDFEITLEGLWSFLLNSAFFPPVDFIRKWAAETNSSYLKKKTALAYSAENQLAVFIFREWFRTRERVLNDCIGIISNYGFREKKRIYLKGKTKENVKTLIRGGVWEETYESRIGGMPYAFIVFEHNGASTRDAKQEVRELVSSLVGLSVNPLHASDDYLEAKEYLKSIELDYNAVLSDN